ncbi:MAG: TlpA disulfide reductase family protein [Candidatus Krumholzibacteria bacterium]|nr:TlpA disulfide reductase family protein [Candidatus Krumholzibacteria bacterium]
MTRIPRKIMLLYSLAAILTLAACGDKQNNTAGAAVGQTVAAAQFGIGLPAPDFALQDIHGQKVTLSSHKGKAVIVDFWATWCAPCRIVMPHLQELSQKYPDQLAVLAVSLDQNPLAVVPPFVDRMGLTFTILADPAAMQVAQQWGGIRSIPTAFLIDRDGKILHQWVGVHPRGEYEQKIRQVLGLEV